MATIISGQITSVHHAYPHTGHPVTTKFARWLNDRRAHPSYTLVKQSNGYVTNVFRAVTDDFGALVPTLQLDGFIPDTLVQ
jgi:hypothetical protein